MATATLRFTYEFDAVLDAIADMQRVVRALVKCHGQKYRDLERRIDGLLARIPTLKAGWRLVDTHWIMTPPAEVTEILRDARRLGVI